MSWVPIGESRAPKLRMSSHLIFKNPTHVSDRGPPIPHETLRREHAESSTAYWQMYKCSNAQPLQPWSLILSYPMPTF
jgi:hypothetical protein